MWSRIYCAKTTDDKYVTFCVFLLTKLMLLLFHCEFIILFPCCLYMFVCVSTQQLRAIFHVEMHRKPIWREKLTFDLLEGCVGKYPYVRALFASNIIFPFKSS